MATTTASVRPENIEASIDAHRLGRCAEATGKSAVALAYFRRAVDRASAGELTRRLASLGAALRRTGAHDDALAVLLESAALDPSYDTNRATFTALLALRRARGEVDEALDLGRKMHAALHDDPLFMRAYEEVLRTSDDGSIAPDASAPYQLDPEEASWRFEVVRGRIRVYRDIARQVNFDAATDYEMKADCLQVHLDHLMTP